MDLKTFTVGPFLENTYVLSEKGASILIDPGFSNHQEYSIFENYLLKSGTRLSAILLTHAHVDHALGLHKVLKKFKCPVYLNHSDLYLWQNFSAQAAMFGVQTADFGFTPEPLLPQKDFVLAPFTMDLYYTPGHSPDHVSMYFRSEKILIAGDVLFRESIGRTDLYKGDIHILEQSVKEKLYSLPADTTVYPGHGPSTTIAHERRNNPYIRDSSIR